MNQAESKAERTRQFIVEKTAPVFNAKGYAGTSLSDLTYVTGLTKGSIYGNFENKDEVALAAFDFNFARVKEYMKGKIMRSEHAVDRLLTYPEVYRDFLTIPFLKPGCPILNTATEADDTHPLLREKAVAALAFWKKSLENQLTRGIERTEIKADVDPAQIAVIIMSLIEGAIMQAKVTGKSIELNIAMDFLEKVIKDIRA
ncbi:TetR/AcrR family transcriptional regulator [Daejeonella sp.]|uniref:TetR/AcrR family transcriptional regulator n=1 Tax=Daejeonella sp. TaxID=2805397 RepID=UPI0030C245B3